MFKDISWFNLYAGQTCAISFHYKKNRKKKTAESATVHVSVIDVLHHILSLFGQSCAMSYWLGARALKTPTVIKAAFRSWWESRIEDVLDINVCFFSCSIRADPIGASRSALRRPSESLGARSFSLLRGFSTCKREHLQLVRELGNRWGRKKEEKKKKAVHTMWTESEAARLHSDLVELERQSCVKCFQCDTELSQKSDSSQWRISLGGERQTCLFVFSFFFFGLKTPQSAELIHSYMCTDGCPPPHTHTNGFPQTKSSAFRLENKKIQFSVSSCMHVVKWKTNWKPFSQCRTAGT